MPARRPRQDLSSGSKGIFLVCLLRRKRIHNLKADEEHVMMKNKKNKRRQKQKDKLTIESIKRTNRVPKELISRFVKICPTCQVRRGGSRLTPPNSRRSSPKLTTLPNPQLLSPPGSRRDSVIGRPSVASGRSQNEYSHHIQGSGWGHSHSHSHSHSQGNGHGHGGPGSLHHLHHSQYQHHVNPLAPTGLGTLPRSISSAMDSMPGGGMHMPSSHLDYHTSYEEAAHGIPDSQY